jgi:4-carboxymuconolactone decarboxylase
MAKRNGTARTKSTAALPANYNAFTDRFPELVDAHERVAEAIERAGPLDLKTRELVRIGIAAAAGLETATKSHVRRALDAGASVAEIEQTILLLVNTCGFSRAAMGWQWAARQIARGTSKPPSRD